MRPCARPRLVDLLQPRLRPPRLRRAAASARRLRLAQRRSPRCSCRASSSAWMMLAALAARSCRPARRWWATQRSSAARGGRKRSAAKAETSQKSAGAAAARSVCAGGDGQTQVLSHVITRARSARRQAAAWRAARACRAARRAAWCTGEDVPSARARRRTRPCCRKPQRQARAVPAPTLRGRGSVQRVTCQQSTRACLALQRRHSQLERTAVLLLDAHRQHRFARDSARCRAAPQPRGCSHATAHRVRTSGQQAEACLWRLTAASCRPSAHS